MVRLHVVVVGLRRWRRRRSQSDYYAGLFITYFQFWKHKQKKTTTKMAGWGYQLWKTMKKNRTNSYPAEPNHATQKIEKDFIR